MQRIVFILGCYFALATHILGADSVRIKKPQIDVVISKSDQPTHTAKIEIRFQLHNHGNERDDSLRQFPLALPRFFGNRQDHKVELLVDGTTSANTSVRDLISNYGQPLPQETLLSWRQQLEAWIEADPELHALVKRYRELTAAATDLGRALREFEERLEKHLIHKELKSDGIALVSGRSHFSHIVKLMPEINPALRIDGKFQRWQYVSLLNEFRPQQYAAYEEEWQKAVDNYLLSKPELAELLPTLRKTSQDFQAAQRLLNDKILKHLHDRSGLSLADSLRMRSFLERSNQSPQVALMESLFTDVRQELTAAREEEKRLLARWGFDNMTLSPFSGQLLPADEVTDYRFFSTWRDPSVLKILGRKAGTLPPDRGRRVITHTPSLLEFKAPVASRGTTNIVIRYSVGVLPLVSPYSHSFSLGTQSELAIGFPKSEKVPVTITFPEKIQPVIFPPPTEMKTTSAATRRATVQLQGHMLRIMLLDLVNNSSGWLSRFRGNSTDTAGDLQKLIDNCNNSSVQPTLALARFDDFLQAENYWAAQQEVLRMQRDYPDFQPLLAEVRKRIYRAKTATNLHAWVMDKSAKPSLDEKDLERFSPNASHDRLDQQAWHELAQRVSTLDESKLTFAERLGRLAILCRAGIDTQDNLQRLLDLAKSEPQQAIVSLQHLQYLAVDDKSIALPYVLSQIDLKLRQKARAGKVKTDGFLWRRQNQAYYTLRSFRSPRAAAEIIQFIRRANDSLLVQGAVDALSHMTLPEHFDDLAGISAEVVASSESAYIQYLDLLLRSDPDRPRKRSVALLNALKSKYPALAPRVLRALANAGLRMEIAEASRLYRESKDIAGEVQAAVNALGDLATSADLVELKYRKGLPAWMNENLVSIIRSQGGSKSHFPFVESFYLEHVRGKNAHNRLTCVAAFEQIGDARAIPYLREIFDSTERKRDAAHAIGSLQLSKTDRTVWKRRPLDKAFSEALDKRSTQQQRQAAWSALLAKPEQAVERAIAYGPLRNALDDTYYLTLPPAAKERLTFMRRFGVAATNGLLTSSEGSSLQRRYRHAELLAFLFPNSRPIFLAEAKDETLDPDRRHTAALALQLLEQ